MTEHEKRTKEISELLGKNQVYEVSVSEMYGRVNLPDKFYFNKGCKIVGPCTIGKNTIFGPNVVVWAVNHKFTDVTKTIWEQGSVIEEIIIGEDVWVGANVVITAGIHIGSHAIIGAGAIVTHNVPEWEIWVGVPAKKIGDRRTWGKEKKCQE